MVISEAFEVEVLQAAPAHSVTASVLRVQWDDDDLGAPVEVIVAATALAAAPAPELRATVSTWLDSLGLAADPAAWVTHPPSADAALRWEGQARRALLPPVGGA